MNLRFFVLSYKSLAVVAISLALVTVLALRTGASASPSGRIAVKGGVTGAVTTLECYDLPVPDRIHPWQGSGYSDPFAPCNTVDNNPADGVTGPHAGGLSQRVDIGSSTWNDVYVQLGYLPNSSSTGIHGGYLIGYNVSTACAAYDPSDYRYNGRKAQVDITHWRSPNTQVNGQSLVYEHIEPYAVIGASASSATWYRWNNKDAATKFWLPFAQDFELNGSSAGTMIGYVTERFQSTVNSCSNGAHLHQEVGSGQFNLQNYDQMPVTDRVTDIGFVSLGGIVGTAPTDR